MAKSSLIGQLRVALGIDSAAFVSGAKRAEKANSSLARSFTGLAGTISGRAVAGALGGLAALFSIPLIKRTLDQAAAIGEVAQAIGVTQKELQVYRLLATQVNLSNEEMEKGLQKLTLSIGKAGSGAKAEAQSFSALGVAVKDAEGNIRPTGDVLLDVADKIAAIPNPAQRATAAYALFGRQGQKLLPLLEMGRDGIEKFAKEMEKAGVIIADGDIAKADKTADKLALLNKQLEAKWASVVAANADSILSMANALISLVGAINQFWQSNPKQVVAVLGALVGLSVGAKFGPAGALIGAGVGAIGGYYLGPDPKRTSATIIAEIKKIEKEGARATVAGNGLFRLTKPGGANERSNQMAALLKELAEVQAMEREAAALGSGAGGAPPMAGLDNLLGGGGRGGGAADRVKKAAADLRKSLSDMRGDIEAAFSTAVTPQSIEAADQLRQRLEDISERAREAGVPISAFSGEIAVLKARIAELETDGLAREAEEFSKAVASLAREISRLDTGAMTPLERRLDDVDDRFESLRAEIVAQIDENRRLADVNEDAAQTMAVLVEQLARLEAAHGRARDAARSQFEAEQRLANLEAQREQQRIGQGIEDLQRARGDLGVSTGPQQEVQRLERELNTERLDALTRLRGLEAARDEANRNADVNEVQRLNGIIALQRQYYDLVVETSAKQLYEAQRLQDAFSSFADSLSAELTSQISNWKFSLSGIANIFRKLAADLFIQPFLNGLVGGLTKNLGGLFAGGFYKGGVIPRGQWGIVGERGPEPVFAGDKALTVLPNETFGTRAGGMFQQFNITTPDADSFRASERQIMRRGRMGIGLSR